LEEPLTRRYAPTSPRKSGARLAQRKSTFCP
jgi:hypothetical protein